VRAWKLGLLALCLGCTASVDADLPLVEVTFPNQSLPGGLPVAGETSATFSLRFSSTSIGASTSTSSQKRIEKADAQALTIRATSVVTDFNFLRHLRMVATLPSPTLASSGVPPAVELVDYTRPSDAAIGTELVIPIDPPVSILPLLRPKEASQRKIILNFEIAGQLPSTSWNADVTFAVSASLTQ
jgi:hypothetical protein